MAALHDARKRGERGARGVETNEERPEPLDLAHRTRLTSFHSVRAYRLGGHVRDARRSIHETPSFLSEGTTNRVVNKTSDRRDTRQRVCASTRCACCSWMSVPRSRREGTRASPIPTLSRTIRVSLRAQPRENGGSVFFRSSSASRSGSVDRQPTVRFRAPARNGPKREGVFPKETRED